MSKRVTIGNNTSDTADLHGAGSAPKPSGRRKAAESSTSPTRVSAEHLADAGQRLVRFNLVDPNAREAFLVGTFNDWQPGVTPLTSSQDGHWTVELSLKPGTYEYRFVVDGRWIEDPQSSRFATNPFGGVNSVLEVREQAETDSAAERRSRGGGEARKRAWTKPRS